MAIIWDAPLPIIPASCVVAEGVEWALADTTVGTRLVVAAAHPVPAWFRDLDGEAGEHGAALILVGPCSPHNAVSVRAHLPWLTPKPLGLRTSVGLGDRLGLATPGHVRALRATGGAIAPIFAQQSIREMSRTGRTPQQVVDDATWGALREGWTGDLGADADHLKTTADIDTCLAAGFSLFTLDVGDHVDVGADQASPAALEQAFASLPWNDLEDTPAAALLRYVNRTFDIEGHKIPFDRETLLRAAVKYGCGVRHACALFRHLLAARTPDRFEVELSVDETDAPTSPAEHVYIATELGRLGVGLVSLAPRYVGRFEKGVDYIGDLRAFDADCAVHAAIARRLGPYKLSLHSGSDKFSIYRSVARETGGLVHVKTAGTSYLEALRTLAVVDPDLFRQIYRLARDRYEEDRASYHVSAVLSKTPPDDRLSDADLPCLLDQFDSRQVLHVTFGSVFSAGAAHGAPCLRDRLLSTLRAHLDVYSAHLVTHFARHLRPFTGDDDR